jgi:DHA1 family bicyclomycin/chloramphenicol resistance-like MFS transporter
MPLTQAQKQKIILTMAAMFFLAVSATDIYLPSLPTIRHDLHATAEEVNLTLSVFSFAVAFLVLIVGEVSNRYGRRPTILAGSCSFSLAALLIACLHNIELIIVLRFCQGLGCAVIVIVCRLVLKDAMNISEQIRANGLLLVGLIVSPALAPVLGAFLANNYGWRSTFVFSSALGFILSLAAWRFIPETNLQRLPKFAALSYYLNIYAKISHSRMFWALTGVYAGALGAYFAFIGVASYLYIDYWHLTPQEFSWLFIWLALAYLLGNQLMQLLNRKQYSSHTIVKFGVVATLAGALILLLALLVPKPKWQLGVVTAAIFLMRSANALINPPTQIRIMSYFGEQSAQALGLNMCIGFSISALATAQVSLFTEYPLHDLIYSAVAYVIMAVITFAVNHKLLQES